MTPEYKPRLAGKQPPLVLLRGLEGMVDLGDGGWPKYLAAPTGSGVIDAPAMWNDWRQAVAQQGVFTVAH
jgi:hypothetical protein